MNANERKKLVQRDAEYGAQLKAKLHDAIRENMSPEGVVATIAFLQAVRTHSDAPEHVRAINEVIWLRDTLLEMIGTEEFNGTMNDLGL